MKRRKTSSLKKFREELKSLRGDKTLMVEDIIRLLNKHIDGVE